MAVVRPCWPVRSNGRGIVKIWVASKSSNANFALQENNILAICYSGPDSEGSAKSYAFDHTKATGEGAFVYEVEMTHRGSFKTQKEVVFVPAKP